MNIWLLTVGEPIPQDGNQVRLLRTGQFANWLSQNGHTVTFVNCTFDHYKRTQRFSETTTIKVNENYEVVCLYGRGYRSSISIDRMLTHKDVAASFNSWLTTTKPPAPDVILASYPIEELCREAAKYAKTKNVPLVMDCRDFWPDIMNEILPRSLRWLADIALIPLNVRASKTLSHARAFAGMTKSAIEWGRKKSGSTGNEEDIFFPFTYDALPDQKSKAPMDTSSPKKVQIAFFGTLSHRISIDIFIQATAMLPIEIRNQFQFIIAGDGNKLDDWKELASSTNAPFEFLGWIGRQQIADIMLESDFGLLPYATQDSHLTLPNKFSEYLSAGLPIISCTDGEVRHFLEKHECGLWAAPNPSDVADLLSRVVQIQRTDILRKNARKSFEETFEAGAVFSRVATELSQLALNP